MLILFLLIDMYLYLSYKLSRLNTIIILFFRSNFKKCLVIKYTAHLTTPKQYLELRMIT